MVQFNVILMNFKDLRFKDCHFRMLLRVFTLTTFDANAWSNQHSKVFSIGHSLPAYIKIRPSFSAYLS